MLHHCCFPVGLFTWVFCLSIFFRKLANFIAGLRTICRWFLDITLSPLTLPEINVPFIHYKFWNDTEAGPAIGPFYYCRVFGRSGAEPTRMWGDANSPQIKSVGVPARLNGDVGVSALVRVAGARSIQKSELVIREIEHLSSKFGGELGTESSMIRVSGFLHPLGVVAYGEQPDDFDFRSRRLG
jgi:hypothetical protein